MKHGPFSLIGNALRFISYIQPVGTKPTTCRAENNANISSIKRLEADVCVNLSCIVYGRVYQRLQ